MLQRSSAHANEELCGCCMMISIYDRLKHFKFNMPSGWTPKKIGIFLESCRFHHSDLIRTVKDSTRWRRIALFGGRIAEDETLFNVNNCIELARCLRSYAERNFETLSYDSNFLEYLKNIQDLVDYFPKVGVLDVTDPSFKERAKHFDDDLLRYINSKESSKSKLSRFTPTLSINSKNNENRDILLSELKSKRERVIQSVKKHDKLLNDKRSKRERFIQNAKKNKKMQQKKPNEPATTLFTEINDLLVKRGFILEFKPLTDLSSTDQSGKSKDIENKELVKSTSLDNQLNNRRQFLVTLSRPSTILNKEAIGNISVRAMDDKKPIQDCIVVEQLNNKVNYVPSCSNNAIIKRKSFEINKITLSDIKSKNAMNNIDTFENELKNNLDNNHNRKPQEIGFHESTPLIPEIKSPIGHSKENNKDSKVVEVIVNKMINEIAADCSTSDSIVDAVKFLKAEPEMQHIEEKELSIPDHTSEMYPSPDTSKNVCCDEPTIVKCAYGKNDQKTIKLRSHIEKDQAQDCDSSEFVIDKNTRAIRRMFDLEGSSSEVLTQKKDNKNKPFKKRERCLKQKLQDQSVLEDNDYGENLHEMKNFPNIPYSSRNGTVISPADTSSFIDDEVSSSLSPSGENFVISCDAAVVSSTMENAVDSKGSLNHLFTPSDIDSVQVPIEKLTRITSTKKTGDTIMNRAPPKKFTSELRFPTKHDKARSSGTLGVDTSALEDKVCDIVINSGTNTAKNYETPMKQKRGRPLKNSSITTKALENNEFHLPFRNTSVNIEDKNRPFKKRELSQYKEMFNTDNKLNEFTQPLENGPSVSGISEDLRKQKLSTEPQSTTEYTSESEKRGDTTEYLAKHKNDKNNPTVHLVDCMLHPSQFGAYSIINQPKYKTSNKKAKIDRDDILNFTVAFKTPEEDSIVPDNGKKKYNDNRKLKSKNKVRRLCNYGKREHSVTTNVRQQTQRPRLSSKKSFTLSSDRISPTAISITISTGITPMRKVDAKKAFTSLPLIKGRKNKCISVSGYNPLSKENIFSDRMLRVRKGRLTEKTGCQEFSITSSNEEILTVFPVSVGDISINEKEEHQGSYEVSSTEKIDESNQTTQQNSKPSTSAFEKTDECEQSSVSLHEQASSSHVEEEGYNENLIQYPEETVPNVPQDQHCEEGMSSDNNRKQRERRSRQSIKAESNQEACTEVASENVFDKKEESTDESNLQQVEENGPTIKNEKLKVPKKDEVLKFSTSSGMSERDEISSVVSHHPKQNKQQQQIKNITIGEGNRRLRERKVKPPIKTENQESSTSSCDIKGNVAMSKLPIKTISKEITATDVNGMSHEQKGRQTAVKTENQESTTPLSLENERQKSSDASHKLHEQYRRLRERKDTVSTKIDRKEIKEPMQATKRLHSEENFNARSEKLNGKHTLRNAENHESKSIDSKKVSDQKTLSDLLPVENSTGIIPVEGSRQLRERKVKPTIKKECNKLPSSTSSEEKSNKSLTEEITVLRSDRSVVLNGRQSKEKIDNEGVLPVSPLKKIGDPASSDELIQSYEQNISVELSKCLKERKAKPSVKKEDKEESSSLSSNEKSEKVSDVCKLLLITKNTTGDESEKLKASDGRQSLKTIENHEFKPAVSKREKTESSTERNTSLSERNSRPPIMKNDNMTRTISLEKKDNELLSQGSNLPISKVNTTIESDRLRIQKDSTRNTGHRECKTLVKVNREIGSSGVTNPTQCDEIIPSKINKRRKKESSFHTKNEDIQEHSSISSEKKEKELISHISNIHSVENTSSHRSEKAENQESTSFVSLNKIDEKAATRNHLQQSDKIISVERNKKLSERKNISYCMEENKLGLLVEKLVNESKNEVSSNSSSAENIPLDSNRKLRERKSLGPNKKDCTGSSIVLNQKEDKVVITDPHSLPVISESDNRMLRMKKCRSPTNNVDKVTFHPTSPKSEDKEETSLLDTSQESHFKEYLPENGRKKLRERKDMSPTKGVYNQSPSMPSKENITTSLNISQNSYCVESHPTEEKIMLRERKDKSVSKKAINQGPGITSVMKDNIGFVPSEKPQTSQYYENSPAEEKRILRERKDKSPSKKVFNQGPLKENIVDSLDVSQKVHAIENLVEGNILLKERKGESPIINMQASSIKDENTKEFSPDPSQMPQCIENLHADGKRILRKRKGRSPTKNMFNQHPSLSLKEKIVVSTEGFVNLPPDEKRILRGRQDMSPTKKEVGLSTSSTKGEGIKKVSSESYQTPHCADNFPAEVKRVLRGRKDNSPTTKVPTKGYSNSSNKGESNLDSSNPSQTLHCADNLPAEEKRVFRERKNKLPTTKVPTKEYFATSPKGESNTMVSSDSSLTPPHFVNLPAEEKRVLKEMKDKSPTTKALTKEYSTTSTKEENNTLDSSDPSHTVHSADHLPAEGKITLKMRKAKSPTRKVLTKEYSASSNKEVVLFKSHDPNSIENNTVVAKRILRGRKCRSSTTKKGNQESHSLSVGKPEGVLSCVYSPPTSADSSLRERKGRAATREVDETIPVSLSIEKGEVLSAMAQTIQYCHDDNFNSRPGIVENSSSNMNVGDQETYRSKDGENSLREINEVSPVKNNKMHSITLHERENNDISSDNNYPLFTDSNCVESHSESEKRQGQLLTTKKTDTHETKSDKDELSSHLVTNANISSRGNKRLRKEQVIESIMQEHREPSLISQNSLDKDKEDSIHLPPFVENISTHVNKRLRKRKNRLPVKNLNKQEPFSTMLLGDKEEVSEDTSLAHAVSKQNALSVPHIKVIKENILPSMTSQSHYVKTSQPDVNDDKTGKDGDKQKDLPLLLIKEVKEDVLQSGPSHSHLIQNIHTAIKDVDNRSLRKDKDKKKAFATTVIKNDKEEVSSGTSQASCSIREECSTSSVDVREENSRSSRKGLDKTKNLATSSKIDKEEILPRMASQTNIPVEDRNDKEICTKKVVEKQDSIKISLERVGQKDSYPSQIAEDTPVNEISSLKGTIDRPLVMNLSDQEPSVIIQRKEVNEECTLGESSVAYDLKNIPLDGKSSIRNKKERDLLKKADRELPTETNAILSDQLPSLKNTMLREDERPPKRKRENRVSSSSKRNSNVVFNSGVNDIPPIKVRLDESSITLVEDEAKFLTPSSNNVHLIENISTDKNHVRIENFDEIQEPSTSLSTLEEGIGISSNQSLQPHLVEDVPEVKPRRLRKRKAEPLDCQEENKTVSSKLTQERHLLEKIVVNEGIEISSKTSSDIPSQSFSNNIPAIENDSLMSVEVNHPEVEKLSEQNVFPKVMGVCGTDVTTKCKGDGIVSLDANNHISQINLNANRNIGIKKKDRSPTNNDYQEPGPSSSTSIFVGNCEESDLPHFSKKVIPADRNENMERNVSSPINVVNGLELNISLENNNQENQPSPLPELFSEENVDASIKKRTVSSSEVPYSKATNEICMARKSLLPTADMYNMPSTSTSVDSHQFLSRNIYDNDSDNGNTMINLRRLGFKKGTKGVKRKKTSIKPSKRKDYFSSSPSSSSGEFAPIEVDPSQDTYKSHNNKFPPYDLMFMRERFSASPARGDDAEFARQDIESPPIVINLGPIQAEEEEQEEERVVDPDLQPDIRQDEVNLPLEQQVRLNYMMADYENEEGFRHRYDYNDSNWFCDFARNVWDWRQRKFSRLKLECNRERIREKEEMAPILQTLQNLLKRYNTEE